MPENLGLLPPHQQAQRALGEAPQHCCRLWQMLPETPWKRVQEEHLHLYHHPWEPWVVAAGGRHCHQGRAAQLHSPQGWARGACLGHGVGAEGHPVQAAARGVVPPQWKVMWMPQRRHRRHHQQHHRHHRHQRTRASQRCCCGHGPWEEGEALPLWGDAREALCLGYQ